MEKKNKYQMKKYGATLAYFILAFLIVTIINKCVSEGTMEQIPYSQFEEMGQAGQIAGVKISEDRILISLKNQEEGIKKTYYTIPIQDVNLETKLKEWGVETYEQVSQGTDHFFEILLQWILPLIGFAILWRFLFQGVEKRMGGVMSFGKMEKIYAEKKTGVTFYDVAGQDEAKESLQEMVDFIEHPDRFADIGAKLPKGALLVGPPGTGKTLLAKAVAGEANVPFFSISGSEFVHMFAGVGASRVRDLFKQAQEKAPCIVFIDEIDAIGKKRDGRMSSNDEREQTLNQLLTEMDGFDSSKGVVILGATNRPEILDPALLRPGRFDRRIIVDKPDVKGRKAILEVHAQYVKIGKSVNLEAIAKTTSGATGADLANIINEAALLAVKHKREEVVQSDLEEALEVVVAGKIKKDRILSTHEKNSVSYHEIGHALMAVMLPHADPVHKITIVPRTKGALGYTMQLPTEEKYLVTKEEMEDQIAVMLGGRAAEEVVYNQVSTGAANDIEKATGLARKMITMYGMTERFDMMGLETQGNEYLNGQPIRNCSPDTEKIIDEEMLAIIRKQHQRAKELIEEKKEILHEAAAYLIEHETITGEEFKKIIKRYT